MNIISSLLKTISLFLGLVICYLSLQGITDYGAFNLIVFGVWLIITSFAYTRQLKGILVQKRFIALYIFLFYYFFSSAFIASYMTSLNRCVALLYTISPIIMYELLKSERKIIQATYFIVITLVFLFDVFLAYEFQRQTNVDDMRQVQEYGSEFYIVSVAFCLCYAVALIIPSLIDVVIRMSNKNKKAIISKVFLLLLSVVFVVFLFRSQFMTAIIIAGVGLIITLLYYKTNKLSSTFVGLVLSFFVFTFSLPVIISVIGQHEEYKVLTNRFIEIQNAISGNVEKSEDMNSRSTLTEMSIETFLENPFFGKNDEIVTSLHVNEQGIGNHAEWFDFLAQYGLCAFFLFFLLFDSLVKQEKEIGSPVLMILFIALGFFNPLWKHQQLFATFLYGPLLYHLFIGNRVDKGLENIE